MKSVIRGVLIIALTFFLAIFYGSNVLALLGFGEIVFWVVSMVLLSMAVGNVNARLSIPLTLTEQGMGVKVYAEDVWEGRIKPGKIEYQVFVQNYLTGTKEKIWLPDQGVYLYKVEYPGKYEFELRKIRIYDWSGLFHVNKKVRSIHYVEVNPAHYAVCMNVSNQLRNFMGEGDEHDSMQAGSDVSEIFDVREYQEGDRLQSVHWKLSARTDSLMVKINSLPKTCNIALIVNPGGMFYHRQGRKDSFSVEERIILLQIVASVSFSLMDQGCPHYVVWYSKKEGDVVRYRVAKEEDYYLFLMELMESGFEEQMDANELYRIKYRAEHLAHILEIKRDFSILKDNELIARINKGKVKDEMESLEIDL